MDATSLPHVAVFSEGEPYVASYGNLVLYHHPRQTWSNLRTESWIINSYYQPPNYRRFYCRKVDCYYHRLVDAGKLLLY